MFNYSLIIIIVKFYYIRLWVNRVCGSSRLLLVMVSKMVRIDKFLMLEGFK